MADLWYFTCEGKQMEPVTTAELKQLASTGYLRGADMVWREGMPEWAKADSIPDLIPPAAPGAVLARNESAAPRSERADDGYDDPPRLRRRRTEDDEFDDDRPRRRRREPAAGMSGLTMGLIIGGVVLTVIVTIVSMVVVATRAHGPMGKRPPFAAQPNFNFQVKKQFPMGMQGQVVLNGPFVGPKVTQAVGIIDANANKEIVVLFPVKKFVRVDVDPDNRDNDVDLYIIDAKGEVVAFDDLPAHNCSLTFMAEENQSYTFRINNLARFPANCTLHYTQP